MKLSVSILSIKENVKEVISDISKMDIDYLHLDVMDGVFVDHKTYSFEELIRIIPTNKPFDVHLMVEDIKTYIDSYKLLNPSYITFHLEAYNNPIEIIDYIKSNNIKVGLSIKPGTDLSQLLPYLKYVDLVLVMSVEPGKGGQSFIENTINRINTLDRLRRDRKYNYLIEVDGGINDKNIEKCYLADIAVVGSFITSGEDYKKQIEKLKNNM